MFRGPCCNVCCTGVIILMGQMLFPIELCQSNLYFRAWQPMFIKQNGKFSCPHRGSSTSTWTVNRKYQATWFPCQQHRCSSYQSHWLYCPALLVHLVRLALNRSALLHGPLLESGTPMGAHPTPGTRPTDCWLGLFWPLVEIFCHLTARWGSSGPWVRPMYSHRHLASGKIQTHHWRLHPIQYTLEPSSSRPQSGTTESWGKQKHNFLPLWHVLKT